MNKELKVLAKAYFKLYPNRDELFITEDKNVFLDKNPAIDHANKTKQKYFVVKRTALNDEDDKAKKEAAKLEAIQAVADAKKAAEKQLTEADIDILKQAEALKLAKSLDLKFEDQKLATLKVALQVAKKILTK